MKCHDAIKAILAEAGTPLRAEEIARRILDRGLWSTEGKTPEATVSAKIASEI